MTAIREFTIKNLAGRHGTLNIVLDERTNLIWGLNGTGKTTLLKILSSALKNSTEGLETLPFDEAEVKFYSHNEEVEITRTFIRGKTLEAPSSVTIDDGLESALGYSEHLGSEVANDIPHRWWTTTEDRNLAGNEFILKGFEHSYLSISRLLDSAPNPRLLDGGSHDERFEELVRKVWSQYSRRSLAEIRDIQQRGLAEVLSILFGGSAPSDDLHTDQDSETSTRDAFKVVSQFLASQRLNLPLGLADFSSKYNTSPESKKVVSRIRAIMGRVDEVMEPQRELESVIEEMYIGDKHLVLPRRPGLRERIGVEIDNESIPVSSLSSGEKQLLHILIATLAVEFSTIMIDEPELSLHPDWQQGLVESMRRVNPSAQFILATHSPELMLGVDDDCVFEL